MFNFNAKCRANLRDYLGTYVLPKRPFNKVEHAGVIAVSISLLSICDFLLSQSAGY